ncbi:BppU family phage baseplate upper protein [Neobacillus niacini]|uniref:BppU family phage baseplate upper protein n=1 Tax=Neobacillus niacini TaxID=86668 RepID=UPI0030007013
MTVHLKRNDTKDTISYTLSNLDKTAVNLTGASVKFVMGKNKTLITNAAANIVEASTGKVEYTLTVDDTLIAGTFNAEFEVTFSDGKIKTYPSDGYILVSIQANIDKDKSTYLEDKIALRVSDIELFKTEVNEKVAIAQQLIDGNFDEALLATNIEGKLTNLEVQYAPQLTSLSTQVAQTATKITNVTPGFFGAVGDGSTDDTIPLQEFFNYVTSTKVEGKLGNKRYKITKEITIPSTFSWKVTGANATIIQGTDNTPILRFISTPSYAHSIELKGIVFEYTNFQPSTNTNSYPIKLETMMYESILDDLVFNGGTYAIYVPDGVQNFWGCTLDNLRFGGQLSQGAIRMSAVNAVPNNKFGRFLCNCDNMIGPAFVLKGYNFIIDTIEFLEAYKGCELIYFHALTTVEIGSVKLENGVYDSNRRSNYLIELSNSSFMKLGSLNIGGNTLTTGGASTPLYAIGSTGGSPAADVIVDTVRTLGTLTLSNVYVSAVGNDSTGSMRINNIRLQSGWVLTNPASLLSAEALTVEQYNNGRITQNKGDANYTVTLGSPNVISYETTLTAPREIILPSDGLMLFNGLTYRVIVNENVASSTNTLTIKSGTKTLYNINTTQKTIIEFKWRRVAFNFFNGWIMTDYKLV